MKNKSFKNIVCTILIFLTTMTWILSPIQVRAAEPQTLGDLKNELAALKKKKSDNEANQKYIGKVIKVLLESPSEKSGKLMGYTDTMKLVNVDADSSYLGKIVDVEITDVKTWSLDGKIIEKV